MAKFIIAQLRTHVDVIASVLAVCAAMRAIVSIIICLHLCAVEKSQSSSCSGLKCSARQALHGHVVVVAGVMTSGHFMNYTHCQWTINLTVQGLPRTSGL